MYTIQTFELGLPDWGAYHQSNDPSLPIKEFASRAEAEEFARNLSTVEICLARVLDEQGNALVAYDNAREFNPKMR